MRWTSGGCVIHHALAGELKSSYVTVDGREPTFTTCHAKFTGTNDFIWHTDKLEPIRVLRCPNIDEVVRHGRLPSVRYASDHICLVTDFRIWSSTLVECDLESKFTFVLHQAKISALAKFTQQVFEVLNRFSDVFGLFISAKIAHAIQILSLIHISEPTRPY